MDNTFGTNPGRSGLAAVELVACAGIFLACAAVCVGIFARAWLAGRAASELDMAVNAGRTLSEAFMASGGDAARTAELAGGTWDGDIIAWSPGDGLAVRIVRKPMDGYVSGELCVSRSADGEELLRWELVVPEAVP